MDLFNRIKWGLLCSLCLFGNARGETSTQQPGIDTSSGIPAEGPLYYPGRLDTFETEFRLADGSPNHPDTHQLAIRRGACEAFSNDEAIFYRWSSGYAIFENSFCLNLRTGAVFSKLINGSNSPVQTSIQPTDSSRNQITYARAIQAILDGASKMRRGHYQPSYGFIAPERPALQEVVDYLKAVQATYYLDVGSWLDVQIPSEMDPESTITIFPSVLTAQPLELVVMQSDESGTYQTDRYSVAPGLSTNRVEFQTAGHVRSPKTFRVRIALVPVGSDPEHQPLDQADQAVSLRAGNRLNYFFCSFQLFANRDLTCTVGTKTTDPEDLRMDLFTLDGRWLAGLQQAIPTGYQSNSLSLVLPKDLVPGLYMVHAKLLPHGSDWSAYFDQKSIQVNIQVAP